MSSNEVGASQGYSVRRHVKGRGKRDRFAAPRAQNDYAEFFNAVDRTNRDGSDFSTTIRTNRYYLRIVCWCLDRVIHALFVVVCALYAAGLGPEEWKTYTDVHWGRHDFQMDLAMALINYGFESSWKDGTERPNWMRQGPFVPCGCKQCYFCLKRYTSGYYSQSDRVSGS